MYRNKMRQNFTFRHPNKKNVKVVFLSFEKKKKKTFSFFGEITYRYQTSPKILQNEYINADLCDFA